MMSCGTSKQKKVKYNSENEAKQTEENKTKDEYIKKAELSKYTISTNHFPAVGQNERVRFLILHYTAIDYPLSVKVLTQKEVSAHYLIPNAENDSIDLLVAEDKRAWHAGVSKWGKFENLNDTSIGIEIVNKGYEKVGNSNTYFDYTPTQIKKVAQLCKDIIERYKIEPTYVLGHSDVAPQRKLDPGPKFPWKKLYDEYEIGAWYEVQDFYLFYNSIMNNSTDLGNIEEIQKQFKKYGYDIEVNGENNEAFKKIVTVFQHHFRPEKYDGIVDAETYAILLALNKKYK